MECAEDPTATLPRWLRRVRAGAASTQCTSDLLHDLQDCFRVFADMLDDVVQQHRDPIQQAARGVSAAAALSSAHDEESADDDGSDEGDSCEPSDRDYEERMSQGLPALRRAHEALLEWVSAAAQRMRKPVTSGLAEQSRTLHSAVDAVNGMLAPLAKKRYAGELDENLRRARATHKAAAQAFDACVLAARGRLAGKKTADDLAAAERKLADRVREHEAVSQTLSHYVESESAKVRADLRALQAAEKIRVTQEVHALSAGGLLVHDALSSLAQEARELHELAASGVSLDEAVRDSRVTCASVLSEAHASEVELRGEWRLQPAEVRVVLHAYDSREAGEVSVKQGDRVTVTRRGDGWWTVLREDGAEGEIPVTHLEREPADYIMAAHGDPRFRELIPSNERTAVLVAPFKVPSSSFVGEMLFDFASDEGGADALRLRAGERVQVLELSEDGWCKLHVVSDATRAGKVPTSFVRPV